MKPLRSPLALALALTLATAAGAGIAARGGGAPQQDATPAPQAQDPEAPPTEAGAQAPTDAAPPVAARPPAWLDLRRVEPVRGDAEAGRARSELCAACHGPAGISIAPAFPNIAGLNATYAYNRLRVFKEGPPDSPMRPIVEGLDDQALRDLSVYYAGLRPDGGAQAAAAGTEADAQAAEGEPPADPALLERGRRLYLAGDPAKGIPPCQGCHGPGAGGHPFADRVDRNGYAPYAGYPALRGQPAPYLQARLAAYRDPATPGHSSSEFVMQGIAPRLDDEAVQALSGWLASLPPQTDARP